MIRRLLLAAADNDALKNLSTSSPFTRGVVERYVAGENTDDVVAATAKLADRGLMATIDLLGEDISSREQADQTKDAYLELLGGLRDAGLTGLAEVSVKLSAIGQALPGDGPAICTDNARAICQAAADVGTTVTLDMEDHTTTDLTLETLAQLRQDFPDTGAVLQAYLYRTESDCRELATAGSRVRLCKGAYREPESVAYQSKSEVDLSYVRCLKILMEGAGYPMIATHDPRLIEIAEAIAVRTRRKTGEYEYQMLLGVRPEEQRRLVAQGEKVRVYVPFGEQWYGYMVRRMAEKPANLALFMRSLVSAD